MILNEKQSFYENLGGMELKIISQLVLKTVNEDIEFENTLKAKKGKKNEFSFNNNKLINIGDDQFDFGMTRRIILFIILMAIPVFLLTFIYDSKINNTIIVSNLVENILLGFKLNNVFLYVNVALSEIILWNGTTTIFNKPVDEIMEKWLNYISYNILPELKAMRSRDFGDFNNFYHNLMSDDYKFGDYLSSEGIYYGPYKKCGKDGAVFADASYLNANNHMVTLLIDALQTWRFSKNIPGASRKITDNENIKAYMAYTYSELLSETLFMHVIPANSVLNDIIMVQKTAKEGPVVNLDKNENLIKIIPGFIIVWLLIYELFIIPMHQIMKYYWYTSRLLCLRLIESNPHLNKYFMRVADNETRFVRF